MNSLALTWRSVAKWNDRRIARAKLHAFDDRLLKDMGISRSTIEPMVRGGNSASPFDTASGGQRPRRT